MIELSDIRMKMAGARRFLLFPSWSLFLGWAAIIGLVWACGALIVHLMGLRSPGLGGLVGTIDGTLPSVWLARQASFHVRGPHRAQAWSVVDEFLRDRYRTVVIEDGVHVYRPKMPRWLRWKEQDVHMSMGSDGMLVSGPCGTLSALRRLLAATCAG